MTGIYKITSPTGRVYIGQSVNVHQRWRWYNSKCVKSQKKLSRSFLKHGVSAHVFLVICELPKDVTKEHMTNIEGVYINAYGDAGVPLLNISAPAHSRHGRKVSDKTKEILRAKRKNQKNNKGPKKGTIPWNKGINTVGVKGRKMSEEAKEKLRRVNTGKKLSPETIAKRTAAWKETIKRNGMRVWTAEERKRQAEKYKGKTWAEIRKPKTHA